MREKKSMEIDLSDRSNCQTLSLNERCLVEIPVTGGSSGEGLPYAPDGWPLPGDKWRWKVGNRQRVSGYWVDRYLYPPARIQKATGSKGFTSKLSVKEFIQKEFPDVNVDDFFASFLWRVRCANHTQGKDAEGNKQSFVSPRSLDVKEYSRSELTSGTEDCKAGNKMCSLRVKARSCGFATKECDVCCSEARFCCDCCCILCCNTIDWIYEGYGSIRCEAKVNENYICGHVAHLDCALRCYMAGTVGGSIRLDTEYYCRRCDNKTDLISHVTKIMKTCECLESRDDVEKILKLGLCILRGSEQTRAKILRNRIGLVKAKLEQGVHLNDIWKTDEGTSTVTLGDVSPSGKAITILGPADFPINERTMDFVTAVDPSQGHDAIYGRAQSSAYIASDHSTASVKLEDEVRKALQELKESQKLEYRMAEEKLYAQKDFLLSLYQRLDVERCELANPTSLPEETDSDDLLTNVLTIVDQIKQEEVKLSDMMTIARGFGRAPKSTLIEHFGLHADD